MPTETIATDFDPGVTVLAIAESAP